MMPEGGNNDLLQTARRGLPGSSMNIMKLIEVFKAVAIKKYRPLECYAV
jgi:hypothetical protein